MDAKVNLNNKLPKVAENYHLYNKTGHFVSSQFLIFLIWYFSHVILDAKKDDWDHMQKQNSEKIF